MPSTTASGNGVYALALGDTPLTLALILHPTAILRPPENPFQVLPQVLFEALVLVDTGLRVHVDGV